MLLKTSYNLDYKKKKKKKSPSAHLESPMKTKEPWRTIFPQAQRDIKQKTRTRLPFRLQKLYEAQFIFKTRGVDIKKKKKSNKRPRQTAWCAPTGQLVLVR